MDSSLNPVYMQAAAILVLTQFQSMSTRTCGEVVMYYIPGHSMEQFFGIYMMEISWKLHDGKLFGNYMLGNFLETMCWEIRLRGLFWQNAMVPCYETQALHGTTSNSRMRRAKS